MLTDTFNICFPKCLTSFLNNHATKMSFQFSAICINISTFKILIHIGTVFTLRQTHPEERRSFLPANTNGNIM